MMELLCSGGAAYLVLVTALTNGYDAGAQARPNDDT